MRNIITGLIISALLLSTQTLLAQVAPAAYNSAVKLNYIRTWDVMAPETDPAAVAGRPLKDVKQTTQYFDGLGRPLQTVVKKASYAANGATADLVTAMGYDGYGREATKYLSFGARPTGGNPSVSDGLFKSNPFQQQVDFYTTQLNGQNETWFYSQTVFETSPLNRVTESFAPGNSWIGTSGNTNEADRHSDKAKYYLNTAVDEVRIWNVTNDAVTGHFGTYASPGIYGAGQLYKTVAIDERGMQRIEFKNKQDQVILKKVQMTAAADNGAGANHDGWLCTYYVYDNLNMLRAVFQPGVVERLPGNGWQLTDAMLSEMCFRYEYDERLNMIVKKLPGAEEEWMVYDVRDRLVFSQNGNLRATHQWQATLYDVLNQPVITGMISYTADRAGMQSVVTAQTAGTTATTVVEGIAINKSPIPAGVALVPLTITYYNDYSWCSLSYTTAYNSYMDAGNNPYPLPLPAQSSKSTTGLVTGTKVRVLEDPGNLSSGGWLTTANFYDDDGRLIQMQSVNYKGGTDILTNLYDYSGKILCAYLVQNTPGITPAITRIKTSLEYDDLHRVKEIWKSINDGAQKLIVQNSYDALGQLQTKKLGPEYNNNAGLETLTQEYNVRGWLLGVNRDYIRDAATRKFGFELGYDKTATSLGNTAGKTFNASQFNGNITGTVWKSAGDQQKRKYDFSYDPANRLLAADFTQYGNGSFDNSAGIDFSVSNLSYDANGNIKTMNQKGWKLGGSDFIDKLTYTYYDNSNRLKNVIDDKTDKNTRLGDFRYSALYEQSVSTTKSPDAIDYTYDANGNLKKDLNKDIGSATADGIEYNHLNLPWKIHVKSATGDRGTITFVYDAGGNRVKKILQETGKPDKVTLYIGGMVFENDVLQYVSHEEGRIRWEKATQGTCPALPDRFVYDYFLKDQLGNVRMVLTEQQESRCYPIASMENVTDKNNLNDPANYIPYYGNTDYTTTPGVRTPVSAVAGYPTDNTTTPNNYVARLNGSTNKIGPSIVLKVMAGDKINFRVNSWYRLNGAQPNAPQSVYGDLLLGLANSFGGMAGSKASTPDLQGSSALGNSVLSFLNDPNRPYNASKPKAYVNWILVDEQFNAIITNDGSNSGFEQVGADQEFKTHQRNGVEMTKSGYLYIYVSNETPNIDVIFDNLVVTHTNGPLLEETQYYPFGLTMAGISSKALKGGYAENKKKYNGIEFDGDFDINLYEAFYRNLDPQIGRWWQIDPKCEVNINPAASDEDDDEVEGLESMTPYNSMNNDPVKFSDPDGDLAFWDNVLGGVLGGLTEIGTQMLSNAMEGKKITDIKWGKVGVAAAEGFLTSGASTVRKLIVKSVAAVANSAIDYSKTHKITGVKDAVNIVKDAAINKAVGAVTGKVAKLAGSAVKAVGGKAMQSVQNKIANKIIMPKKALTKIILSKSPVSITTKTATSLAKKVQAQQKKIVTMIEKAPTTVAKKVIAAKVSGVKKELKAKTNLSTD